MGRMMAVISRDFLVILKNYRNTEMHSVKSLFRITIISLLFGLIESFTRVDSVVIDIARQKLTCPVLWCIVPLLVAYKNCYCFDLFCFLILISSTMWDFKYYFPCTGKQNDHTKSWKQGKLESASWRKSTWIWRWRRSCRYWYFRLT